MKNKLFTFLAIATLVLSALPALGVGFDYFGEPRTIAITAARTLSATASNTVDVSMFRGVGKLDLTCVAVDSAATTVTVSSSPDMTNWTAATYVLATATTVIYTNRTYATTTLKGTNVWQMPGTVTTPTAATAGWATPYLVPPTAATAAITTTGGGTWTLGINLQDCGRYLSVLWGLSGTQSVVSATLTGRAADVP